MAGSAHLTLGLAACSAAEVEGFLSCPGYLAVDAEKLHLMAPELQKEPSWCPVSLPPGRSFCRGASPADWEPSFDAGFDLSLTAPEGVGKGFEQCRL